MAILNRAMHRRRYLAGLLLALIAATGFASNDVLEYRVKAAFVFNFAKFVSWPEQNFESENGSIKLCVLGEDPFGSELDDVVRGRLVQGRPLELRRYADIEQELDCELLFVSRSEQSKLGTVLESLAGRPVLTISELPEFTRRGGMIRLLLDEGRVRFEVNLGAAREAGLDISSRLLSVARLTPSGGY